MKQYEITHDDDLSQIRSDPSQFKDNYQTHANCLDRYLTFTHLFAPLAKLNKLLAKIEGEDISERKDLTIFQQSYQIPNIKPEDDVIPMTQKGIPILQQIIEKSKSSKLTPFMLARYISSRYKWDIISFLLIYLLDLINLVAISFILEYLFQNVMNFQDLNNLRLAYTQAIIAGLIIVFAQIARNNAYYRIPIVIWRMKNELLMLIFMKLTSLTQYTAKSQSLGKIVNVLSNDFNIIQTKFHLFLLTLVSPLILIFMVVVMGLRFGLAGVITSLVIIIISPLELYLAKRNNDIFKQNNDIKDKRVKTFNEIMEGIKFVKYYCWEKAFTEIIGSIRKNQIKNYYKIAVLKSLESTLIDVICNYSTFLCFVLIDLTSQQDSSYVLSTAKILSTIQLFQAMKIPIYTVYMSIGFTFELKTVMQRICSILNIENKRMVSIDPETKEPIVTKENPQEHQDAQSPQEIRSDPSVAISMRNLCVYWKASQLSTPSLSNINIEIKKGEFIGVTGPIGSGKSGLLGTLLDQPPYYSGNLFKEGSIGYVEQEPVIFSCTIRQNIILGIPYQEQKFNKVLSMSCLDSDIDLFAEGVETVVGERGITLSGGQKARLSLARSLYFDPQILLLDDPISAVDYKVAKKIFEDCLMKIKGKKTIILVSHQISYLYNCDRVAIMEKGCIADFGCPNSDLQQKLSIMEMKEQVEKKKKNYRKQETVLTYNDVITEKTVQNNHAQERQTGQQKQKPAEKKVDKIEHRAITVSWRSYLKYLFYSKKNWILLPISILFFFIIEGINVSYSLIISQYDIIKNGDPKALFSRTADLWITLGILQVSYFVFAFFKFFFFYITLINSNKKIHEKMVTKIIRSPSAYFDVNSSGDVNSKVSNDLGIMDGLITLVFVDVLEGFITFLVFFSNVFAINLYFIIPGVLNLVFIIGLYIYCKRGGAISRQLELKLRTPVYQFVGESILGLITINIFGRRKDILQQFANKINQSLKGSILFSNITRVFINNVNYFTGVVVFIGFIIGLVILTPENKALYGVSVIFLIQINDKLKFCLKQMINLQSFMVSVERTFLISELPQQFDLVSEFDRKKLHQMGEKEKQNKFISESISVINEKQQSNGSIIFENFTLRYRPQLPTILQNLNLTIKNNQKVGIVGRTGAGKSSIIQAIFRLYEPDPNSRYELGGIDALKMGLHTLRQKITIIPQTPFLFQGTIRKNLDPFDLKSDQQLWQVLRNSNLKQTVQNLANQLQQDITNISEVFSVGQKQLLCLARALLKKTKYLILDEATSNVDLKTDAFIRDCIKNNFKQSTVITIAHRLNTILDYDRIIVLQSGKIIEMGSPYELVKMNGLFTSMLKSSGENGQQVMDKIVQNYRLSLQQFR